MGKLYAQALLYMKYVVDSVVPLNPLAGRLGWE